jgi:hypothetical protein
MQNSSISQQIDRIEFSYLLTNRAKHQRNRWLGVAKSSAQLREKITGNQAEFTLFTLEFQFYSILLSQAMFRCIHKSDYDSAPEFVSGWQIILLGDMAA